MYLDPKSVQCEYGFSFVQINLLALLLGRRDKVISYDRLAQRIYAYFRQAVTRDSVRGAVMRLQKRNIVSSRQAREGTLHGAIHTVRVDRICPHIREVTLPMQPVVQAGAQPGVHPQQQPGHSLDQIDKESSIYLIGQPQKTNTIRALSEEDIAFHWPNLAKAGFGTSQIQQILEKLQQINKSPDHLIDGLNYAEWELEHGNMLDSKGNPVASPLKWVFISLSRNGSYRKPTDYVSPEEQYEKDKIEEAAQLKAAQEQRMEVDFEVWRSKLAPEEINTILGGKGRFIGVHAQQAFLKNHYKTQIWPDKIAAERDEPSSRIPESQPTLRGHTHSGAGQGPRPLDPRNDYGQKSTS